MGLRLEKLAGLRGRVKDKDEEVMTTGLRRRDAGDEGMEADVRDEG